VGPSVVSHRALLRGVGVLALAVIAGVLAGCASGLRVITDFDPEADLTAYRTYMWAERRESGKDDARVYNDILASRIRFAVDSVLQAKGFTPVSAEPDFLVGWYGAIDGRMSVSRMHDYYPYGWGFYGPPYRGRRGVTGVRVDQWEEGTVLIDIVDADRGELVWRGSGTAKLREVKEDAKRQAILTEAVASILRDFPPGGGG
jgi:hypothetical protein